MNKPGPNISVKEAMDPQTDQVDAIQDHALDRAGERPSACWYITVKSQD